MMKKFSCIILCMMLLFTHAAALPDMGNLTAKSAALYDASGQMLYEMNKKEIDINRSNQQLKSRTFYRSTSMTLSIKNKKKVNDNSSNDYEYDIDNENYYDLGEVHRISLSSSPSSRFNSPQNSRKNSYMEEKNANCNNEDDESFSSSRPSSKVCSSHIHRKNSYNDEKIIDELQFPINSFQIYRNNCVTLSKKFNFFTFSQSFKK